MFRGLYTAWTGMANEQKRLDVISNNMANSNTVGYKDEKVASQAFDQVLGIKIRDGSQAYHNECIGSLSLGVKIGETYTDYSQGSVRQTGGTYDLALSGSGIFAVRVTDKAGEVHTRYTRDGRFHLTKDGLLVDADGNAVQGQNGNITIDPSSKNVSISATGQITADGATPKDAEGEILQGYTEQSNVNVVREMVDMITITRAYEASQKVIHSYDSMLDKSVNQVGALK